MKPLQHKKHTLAKRGLSLLCVLALCLGLLPVTALAAGEDAPNTLYVGNQQVIVAETITYWSTNDSGELTRVENATDNSNDWNVRYNPNSATLTLKGANITGNENQFYNPFTAGIYAKGISNQSVALTIELIGTNTITGNYGIYVDAQQGETVGTNASLLIQNSSDNGRLEVSGSSHGIFVKSGTGNASLTINDASVVAKTTQTNSGYAGVCVQSSASSKDSPQLSLKVNGGSLTANGTESSDGIEFYVGSLEATDATTSLTVSENAIVDARNGGISASRILETLPTPTPTGNNSSGIVFDGSTGAVYGNVTLDESLTINQGETLTIGKDASLTVSSGTTLTNNGTIDNGGTLTNNGTVTNNGTINVEDGGKLEGTPTGGTVVNAPTIGTQPVSQTVTAGQSASFTVAASGDSLTYKWQQSTDNGQNWTDIDGATNATYTAEATSTDMSGTQYRCVVSNSAGSVTSEVATLTVNEPAPTTYTITADVTPSGAGTATSDKTTATAGDTVKLTATANSGYRFTGWTSSNGGNFANTNSASTTFTMPANDVTVTAGFEKYYTITAAADSTEGGTVDGGGDYAAGSSVTLNATANEGYRFVGWVEGDQTVSTDTTYAFNAEQNRTLTAQFERVYTVTVNASGNGTATADKTTAGVGETVSLTATPNNGYRFTGWTFSDNVIGADVSSKTTSFTMPAGDVTATANFAKIPSVTPSTPPTVSEETTEAIADAQPGETVTVDLSGGDTTLDKEVFETLAGKDVTLVVDLGDGVSWTVKGSDVPEDADFTDIDLNVTMNSDGIPVDVVNAITGERGTVQMNLAHDGAFGFAMTLTAPLGVENAGYWANLYHYKVNGGEADREDPLGDDEDAEALNFEAAAKIDEDGSVTIPFNHASQYAIVIDTHSHAAVDVSDLFSDIARDAWYKDAVQYAYDNGLMTGVSDTEFAPEATTTRAMIVSILARLEGVTTAQAAGFADVDDNDWYATAVNWAANVGVVNGYEDNTFKPNTAITREQLAAILMNYAAYKGYDVSARADLSHYSDADSISSWANDVLLWAVAEGLLTGVTDDTIAPQAHATRAQVAAILQRFLSE